MTGENAGIDTIAAARREPPRRSWTMAGKEPRLAEVLADPIVHLVMRRDGVTEEKLLRVIAAAQAVLRSRLCCCRAA
jgi:hypothetical protein